MYKCIIVDDEPHAIRILNKYASESLIVEVIATFTNPFEALAFLNRTSSVDIVFLDVDMPDLSGIEVAEIIQRDDMAIVFTTGHPNYAVQGFEMNISDFLLKPITFPKLLKSLKKVIEKLSGLRTSIQSVETHLYVNPGVKGQIVKINFNDIVYIEALNNYIKIHTIKNNHVIYLTMKEIIMSLPTQQFIRIHKSFIINLSMLTMVDGNQVILDQTTLPLGSSFKENLLEIISLRLIKTKRL